MNAEVVLACRNDRWKGRREDTRFRQCIIKFRFIFIFVHAGVGGPHHRQDARFCNLHSFLHCGNLAGLFKGTLALKLRQQVANLQKRVIRCGPCGEAVCFIRGFPSTFLEQIQPKRVVLSGICGAVKILQESIDRADIRNAGLFLYFFWERTAACPALFHRVFGQDVKGLLCFSRGFAGQQHKIRKIDTSQIKEIGISQLKFLYPLKTLVFPAFSPARFGPFPSFFSCEKK